MKTPYCVPDFIANVLQKEKQYKVDGIAGAAHAAAYKCYKKQESLDLYNSSIAVMLSEMQHEVNTGGQFEISLHLDHYTNNHFLSYGQEVILTVASWLFSHEENHLDREF